MTEKQKWQFLRQMTNVSKITEFHHGDCIGADQQAALMAKDLGIRLICHAPENDSLRAHVVSDVYRVPLPYLERNMEIVNECDLLLACPKETDEITRSGTWATLRYARSQRRSRVIIFPDGDWTKED